MYYIYQGGRNYRLKGYMVHLWRAAMVRKRIFSYVLVLLYVLGLAVGSINAHAEYQQPAPSDISRVSPVIPELIGQIGGPAYTVALQGDYAYIGAGQRLLILDVSDPSLPMDY
jgi:hypothetical protein